MEKIYLGSHVSMKAPDFFLGSVKSAIAQGETTFMFYTGAPQNSVRLPLDKLKI
ncbi:MAG: deoxyribonuclease IV, partial [Bacilli bacterium]|nr:deoxyribonuclease IV [Bacilli bacterium]